MLIMAITAKELNRRLYRADLLRFVKVLSNKPNNIKADTDRREKAILKWKKGIGKYMFCL